MKVKAVFFAGVFIGGMVNAFLVTVWPSNKAEAATVLQCEQPPEVRHMINLMASMPLKITTTETGTRPPAPRPRPQHRDQIAELIGGLQ